jgi:hypothetical protein
MALAAVFDINIRQLDATNAFVNTMLDEEVYTHMAEGYSESGYVWQLNRALYGPWRSPRLWQKELSKITYMVANTTTSTPLTTEAMTVWSEIRQYPWSGCSSRLRTSMRTWAFLMTVVMSPQNNVPYEGLLGPTPDKHIVSCNCVHAHVHI